MAEFNPVPNPQPPGSYIGLSEGIRSSPNTALGDLFSNIANIGDAAIKEQDRNIKANIEQDVFDEVDQVNAEYGIPEATDLQADPEEVSARTLPAGVQRAGDQLNRLQTAWARGTLSESHYWARMNNMVRQLRAKYPGYRGEIDNIVSGVTGAKPANALRNALQSEWDKAASDSKAKASEVTKLAEKMAGEGYLPSDYFPRLNGDQPYGYEELLAEYQNQSLIKTDIARAKSQLELKNAMGQDLEKDATDSWQNESQRYVYGVINDAARSEGKSWNKLNTDIRRLQDMAGSGQRVPPMEIEKLRPQIASLRQQVEMGLEAIGSQPIGKSGKSYSNLIRDRKQYEDMKARALEPLNILEKALADQNFGLLNAALNQINAVQNDAKGAILQSDPGMGYLKAMSDILGDTGSSLVLGQNPEFISSINATMAQVLQSKMVQGFAGSQIFDELDQKGSPRDVTEAVVGTWTKNVDQITKGEVPLQAIQNMTRSLFGEDSMAIMSKIKPDSRMEYFKKVSSPMVTKQMIALRDKGDPESWEMYKNWTAQTFQILFQEDVTNIQNAVRDPENFDVKWDEKNNRFVITALGVPGGPDFAFSVGQQQKAVNRDLQRINQAIQIIAPIVEDGGGDTGQEVLLTLQQMGFDPEASPEPGLLEKLFDALGMSGQEEDGNQSSGTDSNSDE